MGELRLRPQSGTTETEADARLTARMLGVDEDEAAKEFHARQRRELAEEKLGYKLEGY